MRIRGGGDYRTKVSSRYIFSDGGGGAIAQYEWYGHNREVSGMGGWGRGCWNPGLNEGEIKSYYTVKKQEAFVKLMKFI